MYAIDSNFYYFSFRLTLGSALLKIRLNTDRQNYEKKPV